MSEKRGPKRTIANAERIGEYGKSKWLLELSCGHTVESKRKPDISKTKLCCKECLKPKHRLIEDLTLPGDLWDYYDPIQELKIKAALASKVGVPLEQVELANGTASIFLDVQQVKRLL